MSRQQQHKAAALRIVRAHQQDVFSRHQALRCGFLHKQIRDHLTAGAWTEIFPNVFRQHSTLPVTPMQRLHAAVLYAGPGAVICHESGSFIHGLRDRLPPLIDVYRPTRRGHRLSGVHVPTSTLLPSRHVTQVRGIRVTTLARTVIDTGSSKPHLAQELIDAALRSERCTVLDLRSCATSLRKRGRPGVTFILDIIEQTDPTIARTVNNWEAATLRLVKAAGLPAPSVNFILTVGDRQRRLDLAWPVARVYVEFDGFETHSERRTFTDDRERQNALTVSGWLPFRVTAEMISRNDPLLFQSLDRLISQRSNASAALRT